MTSMNERFRFAITLGLMLALAPIGCGSGGTGTAGDEDARPDADAVADAPFDPSGPDAPSDREIDAEGDVAADTDVPAPGCGGDAQDQAAAGVQWLVDDEPRMAVEAFASALALCPDDPRSLFGSAVGEMMEGAELFMSLVEVLKGQTTGPQLPKASAALPLAPATLKGQTRNEYLAETIHDILMQLRGHFAAAGDFLDRLGARDPDLSTAGIPVRLTVKPTLVLRGTFGTGDVALVKAIAAFLTGTMDTLAGQDLDTDLLTLMEAMKSRSGGGLTFATISSYLAFLLNADARFLTLQQPDGTAMFNDARERFGAAGPALVHALDTFAAAGTADGTVSRVQMSGTDTTLVVCCRVITADDGTTTEEPMSFTVTPAVRQAFLDASASILDPGTKVTLHGAVAPILATIVSVAGRSGALDAAGVTMPLGLDINSLEIADLSGVLEGLLPNVLAFDWGTFYTHPIGLRDWMPAVTSGGGFLEDHLLAEWECPADLQPDGYPTGSLRALCAKTASLTDAPHFQGTPYAIAADGMASGFPALAFPDPTWNHLLSVDLAGVDGATDASTYVDADGKSLNTALAKLLAPVLALLK